MKKLLSIMLSIAMIASMAVVSMAATHEVADAASLTEAIAAADDGDTIKLTAGFDTTETFTIPASKSIVLDMNGKTITATDTKTGNYEVFYIFGEMKITGNGTITLEAENNRGWNALSAIFHNRGGVLTIDNGTFTHEGGTDMAYVIDNSANSYGDATAIINDGTLTSSYIGIRNRMEKGNTNGNPGNGTAKLYINGGEIEGVRRAVWGQSSSSSNTYPSTGKIVMSGGTLTGPLQVAYGAGTESSIEITGGTVIGDITCEASDLKISGGAVDGALNPCDESGNTVANAEIISGGTFGEDPSAYVVENYVVEANADKTFTVKAKTEFDNVGGTVENVNATVTDVNFVQGNNETSAEVGANNSFEVSESISAGYYNVVVETSEGKTYTTVVKVEAGQDLANLEVNIDTSVETKVKSTLSNVVVGGLENVGSAVVATVNKATSTDEVTAITKEAGSDKEIEFFEVKLNDGATTEADDNVALYFTFDRSKGAPETVYRFHGNSVDEITASANADGEYFEIVGNTIIIHAKKFSTYAVAYSSGSAASGGYGILLDGPFIYKPEYRAMMNEGFEYGEPVYYLIKDETVGGLELSDYKFVEKLKVKPEWNMGGSAVEGVSVVKKLVDPAAEEDCTDIVDKGYYYFLEIATLEKKSTAETDVVGIIEFDRKADKKKDVEKIKDCKIDVDFTLFYPNTWLNDGTISKDRANLEWDTPYVLKFDYDDEVELSFGCPHGGNNEGTFTVDVSGQGKLYMEYTTEADEAIAAANEGAKLDFITFKGANGVGVKFNRTGEFRYEMEDAAYAYRVVDGKLEAIAGLEVEDDEFVFNTNKLEAYVFSDTELK